MPVEPTLTQYQEIGRYLCAVLGLADRWDDDVTQQIGDELDIHLGYDQHPNNPGSRELWEAVMDDIRNGRDRDRAAAKAAQEEVEA